MGFMGVGVGSEGVGIDEGSTHRNSSLCPKFTTSRLTDH